MKNTLINLLFIFVLGPLFYSQESYASIKNQDESLLLLKQEYENSVLKHGNKAPESLKALYVLASTYQSVKKYHKSIPLFESLFEHLLLSKNPNSSTIITITKKLIEAYKVLGRTFNIISKQELIYQNLLKQDKKSKHLIYQGFYLGELYSVHNQFENSINMFKWAIEGMGELDSKNQKQFKLSVQYFLARVYLSSGDVKQAQVILEKLLIQSVNFDQSTSSLALSLSIKESLGYCYILSGKQAKGLALVKSSIYEKLNNQRIAMTTLGPDYDDFTRKILQLGKSKEAQELNEERYKAAQKYGTHSVQYISTAQSLGNYFSDVGNFEGSIALLQEVYSISSRRNGLDNQLTLELLLDLAEIHEQLGLHKKSLKLVGKAYNNLEKYYSNDHHISIRAISLLAQQFYITGDYQKSITYSQLAITQRVKLYGEKNSDILKDKINLIRSYHKLGLNTEALKVLHSVDLKIYEDDIQPLTLLSMSQIYRELGLQQQSQNIIKQISTDQSFQKIEKSPSIGIPILKWIGEDYIAQNKYLEATKYFKKIELMLDSAIYNNRGLIDEQRFGLYQKYTPELKELYRLYVINKDFSSAFSHTEKHKALFLLDKLNQQLSLNHTDLSKVELELLEELFTEQKTLSERHLMLINDDSLGEKLLDRALARISKEYLDNNARLTSFQSQLDVKYTQKNFNNKPSSLTPIQGQELLSKYDKNTVFLSYYHTDKNIHALTLSANKQLEIFDLGSSKTIEESILSYKELVEAGGDIPAYFKATKKQLWRTPQGSFTLSVNKPIGSHRIKDRINDINELRTYISDRLIKPIWSNISKTESLLISPNDYLSLLAFETLKTPESDMLIKNHDISYTQSLSIWGKIQERQRAYSKQNRYPLYAVANPKFENKNGEQCTISASINSIKNNTANIQKRGGFSRSNLTWCELPGTDIEVTDIKYLLSNTNNTIHVRSHASETQIKLDDKTGLLGKYRFIHFATHGYLDDKEPLNSAIVLSSEDKDNKNDGYLTAAEFSSLNLKSDLVVMSACSTAANESKPGTGISGLPFALYLAGNQNTLMTLWAVNDEATAKFMRLFYEKLSNGVSPKKANNEVKRSFLKHQQYSNPAYWAPFVFYGI
tara:strand:- start:3735 stop:7082 length:3348 start_codon:yes stop_codon:yes gene_type:complete